MTITTTEREANGPNDGRHDLSALFQDGQPLELVTMVFSFCNDQTLHQLRCTNKRLHSIANKELETQTLASIPKEIPVGYSIVKVGLVPCFPADEGRDPNPSLLHHLLDTDNIIVESIAASTGLARSEIETRLLASHIFEAHTEEGVRSAITFQRTPMLEADEDWGVMKEALHIQFNVPRDNANAQALTRLLRELLLLLKRRSSISSAPSLQAPNLHVCKYKLETFDQITGYRSMSFLFQAGHNAWAEMKVSWTYSHL